MVLEVMRLGEPVLMKEALPVRDLGSPRLRKLVADGRRRAAQLRRLRHGLGAHRLRRLDIVFDDGAEDFFLPVAQVHTALTFFSNLSMFKILALNISEC